MGTKNRPVNNSEFTMWRAVFAFALVDNVLSLAEQTLLRTYYSAIPFSDVQREVLKEDFLKPQSVEDLFNRITDPEHRLRFCALARALVWCEGDMDKQEEQILRRVKCLGGESILRESRTHPHLDDYHKQYARGGVRGIMKPRPIVWMTI